MQTYIILLRGVMPTGKNKVPMGLLRGVLTEAGLSEVRTYIQSGNILARSSLDAPELERLVHDEILRNFGGDLAVVARTPQQIRDVLADNPFKDLEPAKTFFVIFSKEPSKHLAEEVMRQSFPPNRHVITAKATYLYCPEGYSNSKVNNNWLEKRLGLSATMRNYNTLARLVELSGL